MSQLSCPRCQGLLVDEYATDDYSGKMCWLDKCANCGFRGDAELFANRLAHPQPRDHRQDSRHNNPIAAVKRTVGTSIYSHHTVL